jgi:ferredoxin
MSLSRRELLTGRLGGGRQVEVQPKPVWRPPAAFARLDTLTGAPPPGEGQRAFVRLDRCLAWVGSFCTACAERCPVRGAITLQVGKPIVEPDACTGCGVCAAVCPAPSGAIGWRDRRAGGHG